MLQLVEFFENINFSNRIMTFVDSYVRDFMYSYSGEMTFDIDDNQVGFIVVLCTTLLWLFLSCLAVYTLIKVILFIIKGVLNW